MKTQVKMKCLSKKDIHGWNQDGSYSTEIELDVPYDPTSVYHKLSGGTNFFLRTTNRDAANMFELGKDYMVEISPVTESVSVLN